MKHKPIVGNPICLIKTVRWHILLLVVICAALCSCDDVTNVSNDNRLWGGYDPRVIYEVKADIFLLRRSFFDGGGYEVSPERKSKYWRGADTPDTIEQYRKTSGNPICGGVKGIITAGTRIKPEVLERHVGTSIAGTTGKYDILYPYGRILSGPYKGMLVNMLWISDYCNKDDTPSPYSEILIKVADGT